MFNKKHKALLFGSDNRIVKRVSYQIVGPLDRRLVDDGLPFCIILNDDHTVAGATHYDRWEQM